MGVGYFLLAGIVLSAGYDLVKANAIKVLIVFLYTPITLIIFIFAGQVNYGYGLVLAIGNVIGALIASRMAVSKGAGFVRWVIIIVIILTSAHLFKIVDIEQLIQLQTD